MPSLQGDLVPAVQVLDASPVPFLQSKRLKAGRGLLPESKSLVRSSFRGCYMGGEVGTAAPGRRGLSGVLKEGPLRPHLPEGLELRRAPQLVVPGVLAAPCPEPSAALPSVLLAAEVAPSDTSLVASPRRAPRAFCT